MKFIKHFTILFCCISLLLSCKVKYSFSGADIDPNIKTVSIDYFNNNSGNGIANMSDLLTDALRDKLLRETNLNLVSQNADIEISGQIIQYYYTVQAPTGNESSDLRRITMKINVDFVNNINEEENWNSSFQNYAEHSVDLELSIVEAESVDIINELLVEQIFNKAFVKWYTSIKTYSIKA